MVYVCIYVYLHMCIHAHITLSRPLLVKTYWNAGLTKVNYVSLGNLFITA